jgi:tetratricopeptide (TPR) repeat protein
VNKTGDPIFDETMKQALSMQLTQSPFLTVASDLQVQEVLRRMGRSPTKPITRGLAVEICQRIGGKAILAGTISTLGGHYILGLEALGCSNGEILAVSQAETENKEGVLKTVSQVASGIRSKLGESLPSLERYDFPVNATTNSLEALKAFSMGLSAERTAGVAASIPFYQHAIQLDHNFALAYTVLGRAYEDYAEDEKAMRNYERAYRLRNRLSEREKYFLATLYNETVTGDLEKAKQAGELWAAI